MKKYTVKTLNVPNVSWKKYVVAENGVIISKVFYDKKEATEFRNKLQGR